MSRRTIYVASPMTTYDTPRYDQMLLLIRKRYPNDRIRPARGMYKNAGHWRNLWPQILHSLTKQNGVVVVFPQPDRIIGRGTYVEAMDGFDRGLDVVGTDGDSWYEPPGFVLLPERLRSMVDYAVMTR
jgi:hypothetical protein